MTVFQITSHADGGCRGLSIKGHEAFPGKPLLEHEREFAQASGTELVLMTEFEVPGGPCHLQWDVAKQLAEMFWRGYDADRLRDDWRGCPVHNGDLHGEIRVVIDRSTIDVGAMSDSAVAVIADPDHEAVVQLESRIERSPGYYLEQVPVMTARQVLTEIIR